MLKINKVELASEAAFAYVENLAQQLGEEHSVSEEEENDTFNEKYQEIF